MKKEKERINVNVVGAGGPVCPNSEGNAKNTSNVRGITLIALVVTIIVMLILVGVTVSVALNGGLIGKAQEAKAKTQYEEDREMLLSAVIGALNDNAEVDFEKLGENLPEGFTKNEDGGYTSKAENKFYVDKNGNITDKKPTYPLGTVGIQITEGGETKTITPDNVADFLGKKVTNYIGKPSVTIDSTTYKVSTEYRLYYIDFEGKYGVKNEIYLKAECTSTENDEPVDADTCPEPDNIPDNIKIKALNPGLYNKEDENNFPISSETVEPPSSSNDNMKVVAWLTNTEHWNNLRPETYSNGITADDINYIVGSPSVEMMMDSYNTHFKLEGKQPHLGVLSSNSNRVKLFYQYPFQGDDFKYGYGVGPYSKGTVRYYYHFSCDYSVPSRKPSEVDVGSLYYPGSAGYYVLSSPSAADYDCVLCVESHNGGLIACENYANTYSLCPLVSLKSSTILNLE